jgi:O-antigen ligase
MRLPHATLVPPAVAATVFVTALGSSSVTGLTRVGQPLRWLALLALLALAIAACLDCPRRVRGLLRPALAAIGVVALALLSAAWSVEPRLTVERAISLALLVAAAGFAVYAAAGNARFAERLLHGIVAGSAVVGLLGLLLLAVDYDAAVHAASVGVPARYQGLGQSPNTVALLLALAVPIATWIALARHRVAGLAALALFWGSLAASASRGGLIGALAGSLVVAALQARSARSGLLLGAAVGAVFVVAVALGQLAEPGAAAPLPAAPTSASPRYPDLDDVFPLTDDLGRSLPGSPDVQGHRTLFGSSGRTAVWRYALGQAWHRPIAGFGFGTEEKVFVDRFADFEGDRVESSYVGLLLQLGAAGLAAFLAVVAAVVAAGLRGLRKGSGVAAAGALAAGLVVATVQSYVYSAGNIAALSFWLAAGLVGVAAVPAREAR